MTGDCFHGSINFIEIFSNQVLKLLSLYHVIILNLINFSYKFVWHKFDKIEHKALTVALRNYIIEILLSSHSYIVYIFRHL